MTTEQRANYSFSFALDKAKGKALPGSILVVKDWGKGKKEFEFKKLESIKIEEKELCDIINTLQKQVKSQQEEIELLKKSITKLAEYIDNQRFL